MARRSWRKNLSDLFKNDTSREVETPQRYLEVARKCTEHAKRMTSSSPSRAVQFNHGQCAHLALKVEVVVRIAESRSPLLCSPEDTASSVEITKLLCRCAKEVEAFIQSCRQDKWVQAAVVLWNASEYVSSLSSVLDFCKILLKKIFVKVAAWQELALELAEVEVCIKSDSVNEVFESDQRALLRRLEAMNESRNSSDEELEVAKYLSGRLTQHLNSSGIVQLKVWEVEFSRLRQVQRLGSGSVGTVRKSMWLGVEVAEKMFYGTDHPSFRNEVDILAGLVHPNIVPLLGYAMDESKCSIVMELMDGDLLFLMEERLQRNPGSRFPFTTSEAVDLMLQTAEGMLYLHGNKVVHRDLKSQNILVKSRKGIDGEYIYAKVGDFGLSKTKERSSSYSNLTSNTGTTRWMAPELIRQGEHDPQANTQLRYPFKVDVFSFGMVCYEILTGKVPFSTISSLIEVKRMVLDGIRPELPDECLPELKSLIYACWESDARDRPSFVEICKRLRCVNYLLLRGSGITYDAHRIIFHADDAYWEERGDHPRLFTSWAVRALAYDFSEMERIQGSRSMFRANDVGGRVVAVKDLQGILPVTSNPTAFVKMVVPLFKLAHENILKMREFRLEEKLKVAVFEYAPLGSLCSILHGEGEGSARGPSSPFLTWRQRVKIAVGVARGLNCLHEQDPPIICGSVTSSEILMFDDDVPKVGHFALLQLPDPIDSLPMSDIRAPWAPSCDRARAPEVIYNECNRLISYYRVGEKFSQKIDIFDFGVVLVELLTGKRIHNFKELQSIGFKLSEDKVPSIVVDPRLSSNYPAKDAAKMAAAAALCIQFEADFRPHTSILVKCLQPLLRS